VNLSEGATLSNLTVTRDNSGDSDAWKANINVSLVSFGQHLSADTTLDNCIITQGRNGVYLNNSNGAGNKAIITNNIIEDNRTGINFCGNCSYTIIENNEIINNWTLGIVTYNNDTSISTALDTVRLNYNTITGNWYGQILVKDNGRVAISAANAITGILDISKNTFNESITLSYTGTDSVWTEPSYTEQRPESVGGTTPKPTGAPPTLRIYNQWTEAGTGFSDEDTYPLYTD